MDKNAIKKYAVWARRELISRVSQRAALYEITADRYGDQNASSVHGRLMSAEEKKQRTALIAQIKEKGYEQVMEEIAYTWFNRFSALRFMEVNGYLPTRIRVFTNDDNVFKPQILDEAINMEMDGLDMQKVYDLKNANDNDALFKYMIITQCNALSSILPGMFQRISDYTELLFPDNLLREGSVVEQMISMIPQEDWTDQVQIIGWLYQYYNTEPKAKVFARASTKKILKEEVPAATQLFTPDWIVRYMVENSLGRLWLEGHPNDDLRAGWKYYLDEAEQEPEVQAQLAEIRKDYAAQKPEEILAIDPCQGSGHILAYMFDVLVQIYEAYGYSAREAAFSIVEHNIWGLDIDERAAQLAYFSVMMKARQYDRRFFSRGIQPHVYAIQESNNLDPYCIEYFVDDRKELKSAIDTLVKELHDAKEYGSILNVTNVDFDTLYSRFEEIKNESMPGIYSYQALDMLLPFVRVAQAMAQKYHVVVTNPPYMGASGMSPKLSDYVKKYYANSKTDLCAVFIERCINMTSSSGFVGMITQHGWMFLSSFEKLRHDIQRVDTINMAHLGPRAFEEIGGEVVQTTSFIKRNSCINDYSATYCRLVDASSQDGKRDLFLSGEKRYSVSQDSFSKIPGIPVAYWADPNALKAFALYKNVGDVAKPRLGFATGDNDTFMRAWFEPLFNNIGFGFADRETAKISGLKWFPTNKGGSYRKWYGNLVLVVNWQNDGELIRNFRDDKGKLRSRPQNLRECFSDGVSWTVICNHSSFRFSPVGMLYNNKGPILGHKGDPDNLLYLGVLNSSVTEYFLQLLSPTLGFESGYVSNVPFYADATSREEIMSIVKRCVAISKADWDSFELSWDFKKSPLIGLASTVEEACSLWLAKCKERLEQLKAAEEELNEVVCRAYGLQSAVSTEVDIRDVSLHRPTLKSTVTDLISYAVGCMLGRFSLDFEGVQCRDGKIDESKYLTYKPDRDGIVPICDDEYFNDDIVGLFIEFIRASFGADTLEENLKFIADSLNAKGSTSREALRNYFLNDFYADHCTQYSVMSVGKRPIYWLFDSGKKNGFKCLIYMHRYQPDTIARIRTDYVHEQQSRYRTAIADLESRVANAGTSERVKLTKRLDSIKAQAEELRVYEEKIHHLADQMIRIDLDDGVKVNYAKFQDVLAKIK